MRRFLAFLLLMSLFVIPAIVSCVPGGYEGDPPPTRPEESQVPTADELEDQSDGEDSSD